MSREFGFDGPILSAAIRATFSRRKTALPVRVPVGLSPEFSDDADKATQWAAFLRRSALQAGQGDLHALLRDLREFLMPPVQAAASAQPLATTWPAGGPWR